ncbi:hypothetical protein [Couchioplanes caeruleus]|uniref:Uncharacterized protein n=1 Tax=Couchioplanes caeruleus TaxID=56438 RepID=A0A3N1GB51_9ACTN|nr:hypothetical protein [Couchioplanes caeruleus]ROP27388.1 hypothetical protein EDD30_0057 [Couchioplanes caeruleus]
MTWTTIGTASCMLRSAAPPSSPVDSVNAGFGSRPPVRNREPVADGG